MYNFPVALEHVFTRDGAEVPKMRAVVRKDTNQPIAAVSHKYKLITHEEVVRGAQDFIQGFGNTPEENFFMSSTGGRLVYQLTYKERTLALAKGDFVGLRVFIENSYNGSSSVNVRIGFLVLSCLNGMVTDRNVFSLSCRHTSNNEIRFPEPDSLWPTYHKQVSRINELQDTRVNTKHIGQLVANAQGRGIVSLSGAEKVLELSQVGSAQRPTYAWDLMQAFTNHITHDTDRLSPISRINRLEKLDSWFNEVFYDGGYARIMETPQGVTQ